MMLTMSSSREEVQRETNKIIQWKARLEQKNLVLSQGLAQRTDSLARCREELQEAVSQVEEHKLRLKQVSAQGESLKDNLRSNSNQMRVLQMELKHVVKAQSAQRDFIRGLQTQKTSFQSTFDRLSTQYEACRSSFKRETQSYVENTVNLQNQLQRATLSLNKEQEEKSVLLQKHKTLLDSKNASLREQETKIQSLERGLIEIQRSKDALQEELRLKSKSIQELENEIKEKERNANEKQILLKKEIQGLKDAVKREEETKRNVEEKLNALMEELKRSQCELKDSENVIQDIQSKIANGEAQSSILREQMETQGNKCQQLSQENKEVLSQVKALSEEISRTRHQTQELIAQKESSRMEEMLSLEERMNVLITDNSHLECQVQASKNEVNEKESLVQTLTQNLEGKNGEILALESTLSGKDSILQGLEANLTALRKETNQMKGRLSERDISDKCKDQEKELLNQRLKEKIKTIADYESILDKSKTMESEFIVKIKELKQQTEEVTTQLHREKSHLQTELREKEFERDSLKIRNDKLQGEMSGLRERLKQMRLDSEESGLRAETNLAKEESLWKYSLDKALEAKDLEIEGLKKKETGLAQELHSLTNQLEELRSCSETKLANTVRCKDSEIDGLKKAVSELQEKMQDLLSKENQDDEPIMRRSGRWLGSVRRRGAGLVFQKDDSNSSDTDNPSKRPKSIAQRKDLKQSLLDS